LRKTLLLFTGSYPYALVAENGFIPQELAVLSEYFDRVILLPTVVGGAREDVRAPNVSVNTDYAAFRRSPMRRVAYALSSLVDPRFLREVVTHFAAFVRRPLGFVRALRQHVIARMTERWIRRFDAPWDDVVLYTWWFDGATLGLANFGRRAGVPVVTRAHGADLYEDRHRPAYIPFRAQGLDRVQQVFSASEAGARYLADRYPEARAKIRVSTLGVEDPGFTTRASTDGVFRIASCSFLLPVKRIDLTARAIAALGRAHPKRRFEWTHFGDGPERDTVVAVARDSMPPNVRYDVRAFPGKAALYDYYRTQPIDLFINTSRSEGTPVTIMEAISAGIPVVATAVGGNVEIVTSENGVVVPADATPDEVAATLTDLMCDESRLRALRAGSRAKWQREYSARRTYSNFAAAIREL